MKAWPALAAVGVLALFLGPSRGKNRPMNRRECVVSLAKAEIGKGESPLRYFDGVAQRPSGRVAWCGIFALWVLHECGLASDMAWEYGRGFLFRLPVTATPQPGDIAYIDQPYQHHAIVVSVNGETVETVDGNQPGDTISLRSRLRRDFTAFYSIEPLIEQDITLT